MSRTQKYTVFNGDDEERVWEVRDLDDGRYEVTDPDGKTFEVDAFTPGEGKLHMLVDGASVDADIVDTGRDLAVLVGGEDHRVTVLNDRELRMRAAGAGPGGGDHPDLESPMAGKVVKIIAQLGQAVDIGDPLVVVEAMKMENDLKAHRPGVVSAVAVEEGQAVEIGDVLVTIDDDE